MGISFTNEELMSPAVNKALGALAGKPLPPKVAWTVADVLDYVNDRLKKHGKLQKALAERHGIKDGTPMDTLAPEIRAEFEQLNAITEDMPIEPIVLPEKDASGKEIWYEPIIFVALRKLIKR